ncbi:hypothetical protein KFL_000110050 [Klebsormidium nitens]|uniref:GDSL esterase/lipase n=1 Tax=Klebsormidium nitens TaxID=105231 RepID=A0A1Y1HR58_KLENI|nr:hypothetical protein KFL_000110050 [Klebsormidium nitens]|eukprot:GAQ78308.1 hypothetical protein KFL_000110050 [Klebsormidium nitens]
MVPKVSIAALILVLVTSLFGPASTLPNRELLADVSFPTGSAPSLLSTNAFQSASGPPYSLYPSVPALFSFGDGGQDVGNVLYLGHDNSTKHYPFGTSFYNLTGRFSDGRVFADFFAQALGLPFLTPSLTPNGNFYQGASFASASSGRFNDTGDSDGFRGIPLLKQVDNFIQFQADARAYWAGFNSTYPPERIPRYPMPEFFSRAIYMVQSGGNDLLNFRNQGLTPADIPAFATNMTAVYETFVRALYATGARKFFIMNIGLFGCTPLSIRNNNGSCGVLTNALCSNIVNQTTALNSRLSTQLLNSSFVQGDFYQFNLDVFNNPAAFGVVNATGACCGSTTLSCPQLALALANTTAPYNGPVPLCPNPKEYLYWDTTHMSESMTRILAHDIFGGSKYGKPKNMLQTFILPDLLNLQ